MPSTGPPLLQIFLSLLRRIQHSTRVAKQDPLQLLLLFKRLLGRFLAVLRPKETGRSGRPTSTITERDTGSGTICLSEIPSSSTSPEVLQPQPTSDSWPRSPIPSENTLESTQQESDNIFSSGLRNQGLTEACETFCTVVPERTDRYYREGVIPSQKTTFELAPITTRFETRELPLGWKAFLHPEGALYFMYEPKRLYTEANLYDPKILEHITKFTHQFDEYIRTRDITLSTQIDVVFDPWISEDEVLCQYYLADHATRSIFWLDKFTLNDDTLPVWFAGITEISHIRHAIEAQYWYHCFLFPHSFSLGQSHLNELRGTLTWSITDVITSTKSTVPYEVSQLEHMLTQVNDMRGRLMSIFARQRFCHFHGQPSARLDRDRSVYRPSTQRSSHHLLLRLVSPIMFYGPDTYCRELETLWIDRFVYANSWSTFITSMHGEWQSISLLATVVLNANVALLAIQSVDESSAMPARSPAQITSYLSVIASVGSIVIGLLLTRKSKGSKPGADDAAIFLNSFNNNTESLGSVGVDILATLYSVPYALLMWR
uniref:WW domain-containing protein n=1 Tax=Moniliophthora roreri TaxID=221103 RepID=A0A0W0FRN8_MONRR